MQNTSQSRILRHCAAFAILIFVVSLTPKYSRADDALDRSLLLRDVTGIVAPGGIPGDFVVYGNQAFTVLTGKSGKARLPVMAAARYGRGRAVTVGHEGFFGGRAMQRTDNAQLAANISGWVAGGKRFKLLHIALLDQSPELAATFRADGIDVTEIKRSDLPNVLTTVNIIWLNQASLDGDSNRARADAVRRWVSRGGGVVISGPAWGWISVNGGKSLSADHSGNQIVMPMGIAFAGGELQSTAPEGVYNCTEQRDLTLTSAYKALDALEAQAANPTSAAPDDLAQITSTLAEAVGTLSDSEPEFLQRVQKVCKDKGGDVVPTKQTPITSAMPFARLKATLDVQVWRHLPPDKVTASPAAADFPGPAPAGEARKPRSATVDTSVPEWHGLGVYAPPGEVVTIAIPETATKAGLGVRIDPHTDTLWHLDKWERAPEISFAQPLTSPSTRIATPYGGTVFVTVPSGCKLGVISVRVSGAVAAPRFVLGDTSLDNWRKTIRSAPGPWAELEGKLVILSVPSSAVRDLDDPDALMTYWDEVMEHCYSLYAAPKRSRPERYCVDRQISAGYMHSGYPIMTWEDVAKTFCDVSVLRGNVGIKCWGFYHEMGHNFQQPEWTWDAFGEVTNNLFSLYGTETMNHVMVGAHSAMTAVEIQKREAVVAAAPGAKAYFQQDPWYPLTMFWLMRHEFGWEPFTKLFAEFRDLPEAQKPHSEAEKHDQFLVRFSKATGHNLSKYLSAWGVTTSDTAKAEVAKLPDWMPKDWP